MSDKPVASPVTLQVNTPEVALSILRTGVENALGFYQVTHIHSFLREALKACEREPLTEADEEYPVTLSGETEEREKFRYTCNACGAMESFYQYRSNHVCPWCGEGVMEHEEMT